MSELLGEKISAIRWGRCESLDGFGECFNPPVVAELVDRWEKGVSSPNKKRLKEIATLGRTTVEYLLGGDCIMCGGKGYPVSFFVKNGVEALSAMYHTTEYGEVTISLGDSERRYWGHIHMEINHCPNCGRKLSK